MASFIHIAVQGNIGNAEDLKTLANGTQVLRFSVAGNSGFGDKKKTIWYRCALFGKQAESLQQYLTKGKNVLVMGEHSNSEWTASDGTAKYANEIKVEKVILQGSRDERPQGAQPNEPAHEASEPAQPDFGGTDVPF